MKWISGWCAALISVVVALFPLITQNHIYTHIVQTAETGSDFRRYMAMVDTLSIGGEITPLYPAQFIVGRILAWIKNVFTLDTELLIITFYFLSLILVGFVIYKVVANLTKRGWLGIVIAFLCTTSIIGLFYWGAVFSLINMYVFLLVGIYLAVKWLTVKKWPYLAGCLTLTAIYSGFHLTALYLPYVLAVLAVMVFVYKVLNETKTITRSLILLVSVFALNVVITYFAFPNGLPSFTGILGNNISSMVTEAEVNQMGYTPLTLSNFVVNFLSIITTLLGVLVCVGAWVYRKKFNYSQPLKYTLAILGGFVIALGFGAVTVLSPEPVRAGLDLSIILAIMIALILAKLWEVKEALWVRYSSLLLMSIGGLNTVVSWVKF